MVTVSLTPGMPAVSPTPVPAPTHPFNAVPHVVFALQLPVATDVHGTAFAFVAPSSNPANDRNSANDLASLLMARQPALPVPKLLCPVASLYLHFLVTDSSVLAALFPIGNGARSGRMRASAVLSNSGFCTYTCNRKRRFSSISCSKRKLCSALFIARLNLP